MLKDAPSMKDVGSKLAWSVRSDSFFVRSQWYSKNVLIGEVSLLSTVLDYIRQKNFEGQKIFSHTSFSFSSEQRCGVQDTLNLQTDRN